MVKDFFNFRRKEGHIFLQGHIIVDKLSDDIQKSESMFVFKQAINKLYKTFDKYYIV